MVRWIFFLLAVLVALAGAAQLLFLFDGRQHWADYVTLVSVSVCFIAALAIAFMGVTYREY